MPELRRVIGLPLLLFFGLGNILGAGIYVLVGKVAAAAGMQAPVAFFFASLVAGFSAFAYAELSSRFPHAAGVAFYVQKGFGRVWLSRTSGLLIALAGMVSAATISRGFHGYFTIFLPGDEFIVISAVVLVLGALTAWGVSQSVGIAAILTLLEIGGLLMVIWAGSELLASAPANAAQIMPGANIAAWTGIGLGAFIAFFAFIGFEDMVNVAEEVRDPTRTMPRAILLALLIATLMYAAVSVVAVFALPTDTLANSDAPLADVLEELANFDPRFISAISMMAIVNGALIQMVMASRLIYGMAREGWLPGILASVNSRTRTPIIATCLVTIIILTLALWLPVETLAVVTSYIVLLVFIAVNAALLSIKSKEPFSDAAFNVPLWVPLVGLLSSIALIAMQIAGQAIA